MLRFRQVPGGQEGMCYYMLMIKITNTKLLTRDHTGKIRHHKHTSYGSLVIVLLLTFVPLIIVSHTVAAAPFPVEGTTEGSGAYGTYAVVPGPTPKAPSIANLNNGRVFTTAEPVVVKGACQSDNLIKIFTNEVLVGAALCQGGSFQLSVNLFVGNNSLIARAYNANDLVSPDSSPINLQLQLPGTNLNGTGQLNTQGAPAGQFYATSQISHRGASVGETMTWPLSLSGGQAPYAVSIGWGDGKTDLISRGDTGQFDIHHSYDKPGGNQGSYTIVIKSTDALGNRSYLQLVAIVSGDSHPIGVAGSIKGGSNRSAAIKLAWQAMAVIAIVILSFWLGEKREKHLIQGPIKRIA